MPKPIKKAIIPVAGMGTRILPATKAMPKEMLTIVDKPIIQYSVEEAFEAGIEQVILINSEGKKSTFHHFLYDMALESALESKGKHKLLEKVRHTTKSEEQVIEVLQEQPLGLGHAVYCAKDFIEEDEANK